MDGAFKAIEVTWAIAFRVWLGVLWRVIAFAFIPSLVVASVLGGVVAFILVPSLAAFVWKALVGLGTVILSVGVCKWVLGNPIADYSVQLVSRPEPEPVATVSKGEPVD